jgi:hypothetical protein
MKFIAAFALLIFFAMSFNAYACLVPLPAGSTEMSPKCPGNAEQPQRTVCDTFKLLQVQNISIPYPDAHVVFAHPCKDLVQGSGLVPLTINGYLSSHLETPQFSRSRNSLTSTVLRI